MVMLGSSAKPGSFVITSTLSQRHHHWLTYLRLQELITDLLSVFAFPITI
jgi:hypothetical protein